MKSLILWYLIIFYLVIKSGELLAFKQTNIKIGKFHFKETCQKQMDSTLSVRMVQIDKNWFYSCGKKDLVAKMVSGFICIFTQTATRIASMKGSVLKFFHQTISIPLRILLIAFSTIKISKYPDTILVSTNVWIQITSFFNIYLCKSWMYLKSDFPILVFIYLRANCSSDLITK